MLWSKKKSTGEEFKELLFEFNNILIRLDKESRKNYYKSSEIEQFDLREFLKHLQTFLIDRNYRQITSSSKSISELLRYLLMVLNSNKYLILTLNFEDKEQEHLQTIIIDILNYFAKIFNELNL
ncbi:MAG: hypothetical protein LAT82_02340 [Nanoarchaeota archaeon]|nr:hypothetical protein [Nanoarchaeota archaeon]